MFTCKKCGIRVKRFDPNEVDPCAFCDKDLTLCPECMDYHENECADSPKVDDDYADDPRNER